MCPEIYSLTFCALPSRTTAGKHNSHHFTGNLHLSPLPAMISPLQAPLTRGTDLRGQVKQAVTGDIPGAPPAFRVCQQFSSPSPGIQHHQG